MSQMQAGWYPDPMSAGASVVRYWDGTRWTQHVQAAPEQAPSPDPVEAPPVDPAAQPPAAQPPAAPYGAPPAYPAPYGQAPYGQNPYGAPNAPAAGPRAATPDGQPLAGWWIRVAAWIIDGLITGLITGVLGFPWVRTVFSAYLDFVNETMDAVNSGQPAPDTSAFVLGLDPSLFVLSLIGIVVSFVYHAGFLRWRSATPGKLALGLRVRLREAPGQLSWGTIVRRWVGQNVASLVNLIPWVGSIAGVYTLVDGLWPLWDGKRQALHDKIAKTNVVKVR